jgi:hypothetical protein
MAERTVRRSGSLLHESFLRHAGWRWARIASIIALIAIFIYLINDPKPRPQGNTFYGYTSGTIGALLIVWLTALGIRKRRMTSGRWSLKAWVSAHVWLGLALVVIATLHTAFHFGWNVHTLAYVLMLGVIASGLFGIVAYTTLPARLSENRGELTETQMLEALRAIDRQIHDAAQPLSGQPAALVRAALEEDVFARGLARRLRTSDLHGPTAIARAQLEAADRSTPRETVHRLQALLGEKQALLAQVSRHLRIRALLEVWLYVHVPLTIALLAALVAHIVSVFYYW